MNLITTSMPVIFPQIDVSCPGFTLQTPTILTEKRKAIEQIHEKTLL